MNTNYQNLPLWPDMGYVFSTSNLDETEKGYFCTKNPTNNFSFYLPGFDKNQRRAARQIFEKIINDDLTIFEPQEDTTIITIIEGKTEVFYCHYNLGSVLIYRQNANNFLENFLYRKNNYR